MTIRRALAAVLAAAVVALGAGCTSGGGDVLTVYSGRTEDLIGPVLERFAEETGTDIEVRYGDTAELALLIQTEGDSSPADVFIGQSPGATAFLDQNDRLQPLPAELLDLVPAEDHAADGAWVGLTGRVRTLVYNTELVAEADLPASVLDLTDPRYAGQLGVAPSNGSFQDFVTGLRNALGDDGALAWLEGIAANDPTPYPNNVSILEAVGRGEVAMGLINHYYDFRAKAEGSDEPTALHFFESGDLGSMLLVTAASILDTADSVDAARDLVAFLLDEEAQSYFTDETFEYPLVAGIAPLEGLPPLESITSTRVDFDQLGGLERTEELIDQSGLRE